MSSSTNIALRKFCVELFDCSGARAQYPKGTLKEALGKFNQSKIGAEFIYARIFVRRTKETILEKGKKPTRRYTKANA